MKINYNNKMVTYSELDGLEDISIGNTYLYKNPLNGEIILILLRTMQRGQLVFDDVEYLVNPTNDKKLRNVCYPFEKFLSKTTKSEFYRVDSIIEN